MCYPNPTKRSSTQVRALLPTISLNSYEHPFNRKERLTLPYGNLSNLFSHFTEYNMSLVRLTSPRSRLVLLVIHWITLFDTFSATIKAGRPSLRPPLFTNLNPILNYNFGVLKKKIKRN